MDMVRSILKDGDSAKFRGVFFSDGGGVPTSCGEVTAKNAFGGDRGFQRFMSAGSTELTFIEEQLPEARQSVGSGRRLTVRLEIVRRRTIKQKKTKGERQITAQIR